MQSGRIKHWNKDKGYGFIDVDNQNEDVFFHSSKARSLSSIFEGQSVYFDSERNDKNQLRATEVTSSTLSLQTDSEPDSSANYSKSVIHSNDFSSKRHNTLNNNRNNKRIGSNKKNPFSTLFSLIAIIAVAVYLFVDVPAIFIDDNAQTTSMSSSTTSNSANPTSITGDVQIDNTIALIKQGGPYPYPAKDGTTFYNRESRLPAQSNGYYREYTVPTPGVSHRGARRIVTGGNPPIVYYLTIDHYGSFSQLEVN